MLHKYFVIIKLLSVFILINYVAASDLTFIIDDTSSMYSDIRDVRTSIGAIFDTVDKYKNESPIDKFILVTFNDRDDWGLPQPDLKVRANTKLRNEFMTALDQIIPDGGAYSCPELSLAGITKGLEESAPRSSLYVFTDATAKDYYLFEEVKRMALEKQCQIVFVLTGRCLEPVSSDNYQVYHKLAAATNGQVFQMDKGDISKVLDYVKATLTGLRTPLVNKLLPIGSSKFTFDADPLLEEPILSLTSMSSNNPTVKIKAPDGTEALKKTILHTRTAQVYSVNVTKPGQHLVHVDSPLEPTRAIVSAKTKVDFEHGFSSFIPRSFGDTSVRPVPDVKSYLSIQLTEGNIDLKSVRILNMDQKVIEELPLSMADREEKLYTTDVFNPPVTVFKLAIVGFDPASNSTIVRYATTPVEVQKVLMNDKVSTKTPLMVIDGEKLIKVKFGEPVKSVCKVEGNPIQGIIWRNKKNRKIVPSQMLPGKNYPNDHVNVLLLEKAVQNATYSCLALQDKKIYYNYTDVTIEVSPEIITYLRITNKPQNKTVQCAEESKFVCTVESDPPANIKWYKNGIDLKADGHIDVSVDKSTLTIKKPTPADDGAYACEASNGENRQTLENRLSVLECQEVVVIDKTVSVVSVKKGQDTTVECKILKGKPKPTVSWTLETPEKYILNIDNWENLESNVITNASTVDVGTYRCKAQNNFSQDKHSITVNIE